MQEKINPYIGKWRITEMEMWDQDYVDQITEGHFTFEKDGLGYFQFGLTEGEIDYRIEKCDELERLEFTWEGRDENDPDLGRGYVILKEDFIEGRFYSHMGDDSWFKAMRVKKIKS
ncbi:MAG: hypothetical protein K9K79_01190 [Desulfohalobiaceae bacterium]|nr:hypothetical protein [Desulfohalobiaceae bacterium]